MSIILYIHTHMYICVCVCIYIYIYSLMVISWNKYILQFSEFGVRVASTFRWPSGNESACQSRKHRRRVWFLGWKDPLEKEMATKPSILVWEIPWQPGRLHTVHEVAESQTRLSNLTWSWEKALQYPLEEYFPKSNYNCSQRRCNWKY